MLSLVWLVALLGVTVYGQAATYTDAKTGIKFWELSVSAAQAGTNGLKMGFALPATTQSGYQDEYIGHIVSGLSTTGSWAGLSHSSGMTNSLLLAFWPNGASVQGSFRWATGYVSPDIYTGNATYTTISSSVNSTHFEIIYRCMHCWVWQQDGVSGSQIPPTAAGGNLVFGWVKHTATPATPADPEAYLDQHAYYNIAVQPAASMRDTAYTSWISKGGSSTTRTATATTTTAAPTTTAPAACAASQTAGTDTYDYIVAGAGAGGIPIAAKLAEAGKKVLLVEKGPPSSGRWGGTIKPKWLEGTNLTRFDVPGLCNQIWVDSEGIACRDASSMAGCVLGGGTAINAGLWWKPNPADFDENFPSGWKSGDMNGAISRVFQKIPGTYIPSMDGKTYLRAGFNALSAALASASWTSVDANAQPGSKQKAYSQTPYMFSNGERGGPMATYLVEASKRSNFKLLTNTGVRRIIRTGGKATGVELEAQTADGKCGTVKLSATGRVIVSAGVFGTSKILMRSGIGPTDQLNIVKASTTDGASMIASSSWLNLPVGKNLDDHTNTDVVIDNTDAQFYDFYQAYTDPIPSDKTAYLTKRSGILAQAAPNIGPVFWEVITGSDRSQRQLQWTARVEGGHDITANTSMVISQYLGRGKTSRGRITITPSLSMTVSELPFVNTAGDVAAIVQGIKNLKEVVAKSPKLTMKYPTATESVEDFVANYPNSVGSRTANHWVGTAKMGTDSGLSGGSSVVDTNTKVYGTDNIFVVDASVFPGMVTTNPSSLIMAVAERASERILAL